MSSPVLSKSLIHSPWMSDFYAIDRASNLQKKINLQALEVWDTYLQESAEKDSLVEHNWMDQAVDVLQGWVLGRSPNQERVKNTQCERALFSAVKDRVESGKATTLHEAMKQVSNDGESLVKNCAQFYLNEQSPKTFSKSLIRGLVDLTRKTPADEKVTLQFLDDVFKVLESQGTCHKTALGVYQLVDAISSHEDILVETQRHLAAFQGNAGLLRSVQREIYGINPINIGVEIGLIGISGGVGNLAKTAYKLRYAPALWNTPKILVGGFAVHSVTMGSSLGTLHVAKSAVTEDIQSLSVRKIGKIYLKDTLMVPVTHLFGSTGKFLFAESAIAQHGMGLAGMSTSTQLYIKLMPEDAPIGGVSESIAADIVGYGTFTVGGKVAGKLSEGVMLPDLNGSEFKNLHVQMATLLMGGVPIVEGSSEVEGVKFTPEIQEINGVRFARIPAGKFKMGAKDIKDANPVREVELSEFYMMENLVTNKQFDAYMAANQSKPYGLIGVRNGRTEVFERCSVEAIENNPCWNFDENGVGSPGNVDLAFSLLIEHGDPKEWVENANLDMEFQMVRLVPKGRKLWEDFSDPQQPAVEVTWFEALGYAVWLDQQMREQGIPIRVSLPSEAQWEKAARGPEGYEYGTETGELTEALAHYGAHRPVKVGSKPANGYGCHDMAGNAWQWVMDRYQNSYQGLPGKDPVGPVKGETRGLRGGTWHDFTENLMRAAYRSSSHPHRNYGIGFRVVAVLSQD
ncbi:MAG: SUMF1/EgtB/PvdO family nonheme iron enzyme [Deltaproteobacteria bacterium]|nr:SUMF1/EgtB/PvdO family nonheme iron enzyme [Deltaproteobacteria bacterium]